MMMNFLQLFSFLSRSGRRTDWPGIEAFIIAILIAAYVGVGGLNIIIIFALCAFVLGGMTIRANRSQGKDGPVKKLPEKPTEDKSLR